MKTILMMSAAIVLLVPVMASATTTTVGNTNDSTSAVIIEGSSTPDETTVRTNPDVSSAPVMTTGKSCYVGQGSLTVGSYLFGGVSGSKTMLDEGCEAREDSAHLANLAVTRYNLGYKQRAEQLMTAAELRMGMKREDFEKTFATHLNTGPWEELWNP